jgi:hypothetical protein
LGERIFPPERQLTLKLKVRQRQRRDDLPPQIHAVGNRRRPSDGIERTNALAHLAAADIRPRLLQQRQVKLVTRFGLGVDRPGQRRPGLFQQPGFLDSALRLVRGPPVGDQRGRDGHHDTGRGDPADAAPSSHAFLQRPQMPDALPALQQREVRLHFVRALVTAFLGAFTRLEHHGIKLQGVRAGLFGEPFRGHLRKAVRRIAGDRLVQHHAERIKVSARRTRTFGRNIPFGPHERAPLPSPGNQADVRQLRATFDEDDVARLDVPMDQSALMQSGQSADHIERQSQAVGDGQAAQAFQVKAERPRCVNGERRRIDGSRRARGV